MRSEMKFIDLGLHLRYSKLIILQECNVKVISMQIDLSTHVWNAYTWMKKMLRRKKKIDHALEKLGQRDILPKKRFQSASTFFILRFHSKRQ